ncbi:response regulator [Hoeflea sp.]|uniref:response regulator n=1 Tax=Hoeflea sp. TaxID=1940281 RepID=UPI003A95089D
MALNETGTRRPVDDVKRIEALASVLDVGIMIYDRNDTLIAASTQFLNFFDVDPDLLKPGARLRDLFNATYDTDARVLGSLNGETRQISREDWVAERIAIHWRERYESVEKLSDGRWIRLRKRRMPDGLLISISEDITDQKTTQEEVAGLLRKADLVKVILDDLSIQVLVKDSELRYVMVNEAFCRVFGLPRKYILGRKSADFVGPELAARFEKLEKSVLETGNPYDAIEDLHSADGRVMKVITRMRRTGAPGAYTVTIAFDDLSELWPGHNSVSAQQQTPGPIASEPGIQAASVVPEPVSKGRVLIVDENLRRSMDHVGALKAAGFDAVATANTTEALAFLDAAKAMDLTVHEVELSAHMARVLSAEAKAGWPVLLRQAIEKKLASEPKALPEAAPVPTPARVEKSPVLSVVESTSALQPEAKVVSRAEPVGPAPSEPAAKTIKTGQARDRVRVLVAEDNDVNQIVFEQILEGIGADFRIVNNGEEAVAAWRAAAPDLILMDVSMPVMNGLQAVRAIRNAEASEAHMAVRVPVIAVTAHAMGGDRERCLAAGMDDYLSKPVSPEKLEAIIQKWVDRSERFQAAG